MEIYLSVSAVQGFLTAVKQEVNRRHAAEKWALDDVVMTAEVLHPAKEVDQIRDAPQEGVYVYGLYLDGCAWSNKDNKLVESEPKKLYHPLPVLYVTGVLVSPKYFPRGSVCHVSCCLSAIIQIEEPHRNKFGRQNFLCISMLTFGIYQ